MPRKNQNLDSKIETRFSKADIARITKLTAARQTPKSEFVREAVRWYLNYHDSLENQKKESELALSLRTMTDRICGMLARQGAQVGTLFELAWQTHVENEIEGRFHDAASHVKQKMRKRLTDDERAIADKMKNVVR